MMTSAQVTAELNPALITPSQAPVLQGVGVSKSVEDATGTLSILSNVDLTLSQGQTMAIVGASGSGKSTLLSILAGLDTPSSGQVLLAGQDLFALDEDARAAWRGQHLGFVFQNFQLLPHLTALENVMLPLELASRKDARSAAADMLDRVGLASRLRHYPKVMSGGEQQRVALARAFVMRPTLLIADEPTTALDVTTQVEVLAAMRNIVEQFHTAAIYITHDLAVVAQMADRIMVLRHGLEVEEAPTREMLKEPKQDYTKTLWAVRSLVKEESISDDVTLSVRNVDASYSGVVKVLDNVTVRLPRGRTVAVVGESGSGKSTLARAITGLLPPSKGEIQFNGKVLPKALKDRDKDTLRRIQMIYQSADTSLNPRQTIRDIIGRPLEFYHGV